MADLHEVVVNDVCKVISREPVAFEKDRVWRNVCIFPNDITQDVVVEFCLALERNLESDYIRLACIKICLYFFWSKVAAVSVVTRSHFIFCLNLSDSFKTLCITETVISLAVFDKFVCVLLVKLKTLALNIRAVFSAFFAALIPLDSEPGHCIVQVLNVFFIVACAVCVFETENEFTALASCIKIVEKCCSDATDVLHTCW